MLKLIAAAAVAIVTAALVPTLPSSAAVEPTRILLLGDSVTHGFEGEYTWRYFASKHLGGSVDFVGPHTGTWSAADEFGGSYADPNFDTDHAARFGLSMWETLYWNSASAPSVTSLMDSDPDVLVLTLGINDLTGVNQTPADTIGHARTIVQQARAVNPGVDVVLFSLPQVWFERVPVYNAMLPDLATELSTEASRVVVTPLAEFENGVDTYDDSHPTTQGQVKIAAQVVAGLDELGVRANPEPTATPSPTTPPTQSPVVQPVQVAPVTAPPRPPLAPPTKVRAHRASGAKVVVRWKGDAGRYAVRCGTKVKATSRTRAVVRSMARTCKVRALADGESSRWVKARVRR